MTLILNILCGFSQTAGPRLGNVLPPARTSLSSSARHSSCQFDQYVLPNSSVAAIYARASSGAISAFVVKNSTPYLLTAGPASQLCLAMSAAPVSRPASPAPQLAQQPASVPASPAAGAAGQAGPDAQAGQGGGHDSPKPVGLSSKASPLDRLFLFALPLTYSQQASSPAI